MVSSPIKFSAQKTRPPRTYCAVVPMISKTVIRGKNMVTLLMLEEQYYRVRNRIRGSIEIAEAAEEIPTEMHNLHYQVV
jgi:hypothetical protein